MLLRISVFLLLCSATSRAQTATEVGRLYDAGNKHAAYKMAQQLLRSVSTRAYASFALGKYYAGEHQWDTAVHYFSQAISWDENTSWISGWSHALLAKCYIDSNFTTQGLQQLHETINLSATYNSVEFAVRLLDSLERSTRTNTIGQLPAWVIMEGSHVSYYFQDTISWSHSAPAFIAAHERAYERIDSIFHANLPKKAKMYVWKDRLQAQRILGESLGFANAAACTCNVQLFQTPGHELTHILSYWGWGEKPAVTTRFINEGVAVAFDCSGRDKYEAAKRAINRRDFGSVMYVWENDRVISEEVLYPVGGAFLTYLYLHSTLDEFRALIKSQTIAAAQKIYGQARFEQMIREFDRLIGFRS